jgi:hypothetical protein
MTIPATDKWELEEGRLLLDVSGRWGEIETLAFKSTQTRGGFLSFDINLPKRPRSTGPGSASNHFHGHCQQLTMVLGTSFDKAKLYVKLRAAIELGYPATMFRGIAVPNSEADATVEDENKLIEMCHIIAFENGVTLIEEEDR